MRPRSGWDGSFLCPRCNHPSEFRVDPGREYRHRFFVDCPGCFLRSRVVGDIAGVFIVYPTAD